MEEHQVVAYAAAALEARGLRTCIVPPMRLRWRDGRARVETASASQAIDAVSPRSARANACLSCGRAAFAAHDLAPHGLRPIPLYNAVPAPFGIPAIVDSRASCSSVTRLCPVTLRRRFWLLRFGAFVHRELMPLRADGSYGMTISQGG